MDLRRDWRLWIRPFIILLYFILALFVALPLCIIELNRADKPTHVQAWFASGIFVLCALPISFFGMLQHLVNYTQPNLQRHIIRILWMVPIYGVNATLSENVYEAYVIYNFMAYLLQYLNNQHQLEDFEHKDPVQHICPLCCIPPWRINRNFIQRCKHGALQYTIVRPLTTIVALACEMGGKYHEGDFDFKSAWSYLVIINNISQIIAMYSLVLFYKAMKTELAPINPVPKFLCVKFVVFFCFWQSLAIAILVKLDVIPSGGTWDFYHSITDVATGLQDFIICVEMFIAAIAHYYSFSHKPFIVTEENLHQSNCCEAFLSMWDVSDMRDDVLEHAKIISKAVKKTVSKPRIKTNETERTPLIRDSQTNYTSDGGPSDWDTASLEQREITHKKSVPTESMNNYIVFGSSSETNYSNDTQTDVRVRQKDHVTSDKQEVENVRPIESCDTKVVSSNQEESNKSENIQTEGLIEVEVHSNIDNHRTIDTDQTGSVQADVSTRYADDTPVV
ncbi:Transmembrane protein 184 homolog DDB_G0279555,Transmembrane protein 184C [Mytilus coruscus]|uniref:Transmembrane protein 184 homolog DDB_G0279555,Transmembrane protein 184C n=1 Tax=Mytilus coruscus TaxID=42192 RepID=A0A6J8DW55_MYTCO|nr:Transmembrane protein 184 homolog DDB_G0279555,Transmembrane protein 184C [Mytilus coruscus]